MSTTYLGLGFAALLLGAAACGGGVVTGGAGGGGSGSTGTGAASTTGTGAGSTTGTGAASTTGTGAASTTATSSSTGTSSSGGPCPAGEPSTGAPCAGVPSGFRCTYGMSTRPDCRDVWICNGSAWTTTKSVCSMSTGCPASEPSTGTVCSMAQDTNMTCTFGDDICLCSACGEGPCMAPPIQWECSTPPTTAGCPPVVPNDGTPCDAEGVECTYGLVCSPSGAVVDCKNGLWKWNTMIACGA